MTIFFSLIVLFFTIIGIIVTGMAVGTIGMFFEKDITTPQFIICMALGGITLGIITYIIFFG